MASRWKASRWNAGRFACSGSGGGGGGGAPPVTMVIDLIKITASPLELGAELPVTLTFNTTVAGEDGPFVSRTVQDDDGNPAVDILGDADPVPTGGMGFVYTKTLIGGTVDFTYTADDGTDVAIDVEQYVWLPKVYAGVAAVPGLVDETFIEALPQNELRADKGIVRTGLTWTLSEYIWVAFPQAYNPTVLTDFLVTIGGAGFPGGFVLDTAGVSVTPNTPNGIPALYDVWRSTGSGTGLVVDLTVSP